MSKNSPQNIRIICHTKSNQIRKTWKRKEPLAAGNGCRLTGPVDRQSNWQIAVGLGRPVGRPAARGKLHFELAIDRQKTESKLFQVGRSTDRQTCTNVHVLDTGRGRPAWPGIGPVDQRGQPPGLKTDFNKEIFWTWENFQNNFVGICG